MARHAAREWIAWSLRTYDSTKGCLCLHTIGRGFGVSTFTYIM